MKKYQTLILPAIALVVLQNISCTSTKQKEMELEPLPIITEPKPQQPQLTPQERVKYALELFENGEQDEAKEQLHLALQDQPNFKFAKQYLKQLEVNPQEFLGKNFFKYRVAPSETLSLISERFLGDRLKFIILARYNQLKKPRHLEIGQILRIPKRYFRKAKLPPVLVVETFQPLNNDKKNSIVSEQTTPTTQQHLTKKLEPTKPISVFVEKPEPTTPIPVDTIHKETQQRPQTEDNAGAMIVMKPSQNEYSKQRTLLADDYRVRAAQLIDNKHWQEARKLLSQASNITPNNALIIDQLAILDSKIKGQKLYKTGQLQLSQNHFERAYTSLKSASTFEPKNTIYTEALNHSRNQLVNWYHRKALIHYRQEQLNEAKNYWQKILKVDPDNKIALSYLSKAKEIQKQLLEIEKKQGIPR